MAIEILKHGKNVTYSHEGVKWYKMTCPNCGCIFEASWNEWNYIWATEESPRIFIDCPECGHKCMTYKEDW